MKNCRAENPSGKSLPGPGVGVAEPGVGSGVSLALGFSVESSLFGLELVLQARAKNATASQPFGCPSSERTGYRAHARRRFWWQFQNCWFNSGDVYASLKFSNAVKTEDSDTLKIGSLHDFLEKEGHGADFDSLFALATRKVRLKWVA